MKALYTLIIVLFASNAYALGEQEDKPARNALFELQSRIEFIQNKSETSSCAAKPSQRDLIEASKDLNLTSGDIEARKAILDLRASIISLEIGCEISVKNFVKIDSVFFSNLHSPDVDNILRRKILDLRSIIFRLTKKKNIEPKETNTQSHQIEQEITQLGLDLQTISSYGFGFKTPFCDQKFGKEKKLWNNCKNSNPSGNRNSDYEDYFLFLNGKITNLVLPRKYKNGYQYCGEISQNLRHGNGILYYGDVKVFEGQFKNDEKNGAGKLYDIKGSLIKIGFWQDGVFLQDGYTARQDQLSKNEDTNTQLNPNSLQQSNEQRERQIQLETQQVDQESRKIDVDKRQREQAKQVSRISIAASVTQPDLNGVVTINIQTNADISSMKINGEEQGGKADGNYTVKKVARVGQETKFTIAGIDVNGNTDSKIITVVRQPTDSKAVFEQLNAAHVKPQPARDAVAIIIGIEKYKRIAKADYANADAQDFYDYASRALGIKQENIKLLFDDGADDVEIYKAFQNWLPVKVNKGKTDVYVFYSGHGYPGQDGNSLYILPYGADKDLISKTAINQHEIIASIQNTQPRTVTMFLDSCYSGQTRGGDILIAGARPIAPKISANSYPQNFTVISASANDQISSSSPDLKHGIFSYYLMKGMEGDADLNKDGKITVAEMQEYLTDMVGRQAMGMNRKQQPQLFGDPERVLIGK